MIIDLFLSDPMQLREADSILAYGIGSFAKFLFQKTNFANDF